MLADFEQLLKDHNLYFESRLCDLPHSCTNSEKVVLDFDKIKEEFYRRFRKNENRMPKSADALLIKANKPQIIFIELKDLSPFFEELRASNISHLELNERFKLIFADQFQVDKKIIDSYALIFEIATNFEIDNNFFPYLLKETKRQFYFVLCGNSRDFVKVNIALLALQKRYNYLIFNKVDFIQQSFLNQTLASE